MANVYAFESSLVMMIAATFVLAGMVKGVTGMGLPTRIAYFTGCGGGHAAVAFADQ